MRTEIALGKFQPDIAKQIARPTKMQSGGMRVVFSIASVVLLALAIGIPNAGAMQYERVHFDDGDTIIMARGPIVRGDTERLRDFLLSMQAKGDRVIGLALDSPGGSLIEAETLAGEIKQRAFGIFVPKSSECSSACFLLFAAASQRTVGSDALIGIHSASENGEETPISMGLTTAMARDLGQYGVPPAIIGKLVQTPPGRTAWLLPSDLIAMDVKVIPDKKAPRDQRSPAVRPTVLSEQPQPKSSAFQEGLAARQAMEKWFVSLIGEYRAGAEYWAGQRSLPKPGSCYSPPAGSKAWSEGCLEAQRRFAPSDIRRKSEPEFKEGWNSN